VCMGGGDTRFYAFVRYGAGRVSEFYVMRCIHDIQ